MAENNSYIPILQQFNEFLVQRDQRIDKNEKEKRMNFLSANFIQKLQEASTTDEIAKITLQSNKIASVAGIPELANLINNYARIKQSEVENKEELAVNQAVATSIYERYKDQEAMVVRDGEPQIVKYSDMPAFQNITKAPLEAQPQLFQDFRADNQLELQQHLIQTEQGYGFSVSYFDPKTKTSKIKSRFAPTIDPETGETYYDDELTKDVERVQEPGELSEFKLKLQTQKDAANYSHSLNERVPRLIIMKDGSAQWAFGNKDAEGNVIDANEIAGIQGTGMLKALSKEETDWLKEKQKGSVILGTELQAFVKEHKTAFFRSDPKIVNYLQDTYPQLSNSKAQQGELKFNLDDVYNIYQQLPPEGMRSEADKDFVRKFGADVQKYEELLIKMGMKPEQSEEDPYGLNATKLKQGE